MEQPTMGPHSGLKARDVICKFDASAAAKALLANNPPIPVYLAQLAQRGLHKDALRFVAHALPPRVAVWWGLLCVWQIDRPEPTGVETEAIRAALRWVQEPTEEHRRAAYDPGQAATGTPAGGLALAAFWSGGSMAPRGRPDVAPPADLCAKTIAAAALAAVNQGDPKKRNERTRQFLLWAEGVVQGKIRWE